jgi:PucR family transcriptional regulator, purine catabolism regulatory protein
METKEILTVQDALRSPYFKPATVVAGHSGLQNTISWAHILEITECKDYVNGNELVFTTGVGWKNEQDPLVFMQNLISKNVTALCIQLGAKFSTYRTVEDIPSEVLDEANRAGFPLITFPEEHDCRYVDLIRNLHSMILNKSYKTLMDQEKFMQELYLLLVKPHDTTDILLFIHRYINAGIAFIPVNGKATFIPVIEKKKQKEIAAYLETIESDAVTTINRDNLYLAFKNVNACNQKLGCLVLFSSERSLCNFDYLVLEKCSITIAQEYMGKLFAEEKERLHREQWVSKWLSGRLSPHQIEKHLQETGPFLKPSGCVVCLANEKLIYNRERTNNDSLLNITGIVRSIFEQQGFHLFWQNDNYSVIYLLLNLQGADNWKNRLNSSLNQIRDLVLSGVSSSRNNKVTFCVGRMTEDLSEAQHSLETAKETQFIKEKLGCIEKCFYDELHVFRIIQMLDKQSSLETFVHDYLHPIMDKKSRANKNFLNTLIALRDCQYNKKEAAEKLFLARQSLYQRISILENLFGPDFLTSPEKRVCLEIALYGLDYLNKKNSGR